MIHTYSNFFKREKEGILSDRYKSRLKSRIRMYTAASGFLVTCFVYVFVAKPNYALFMFVHREETQVKMVLCLLGKMRG